MTNSSLEYMTSLDKILHEWDTISVFPHTEDHDSFKCLIAYNIVAAYEKMLLLGKSRPRVS